MQIELEISGGFTGIRHRFKIEGVEISRDELRDLESKIASARFFQLSSHSVPAGRGAPDYRTYRLSIDMNGDFHTVERPEALEGDPFQDLVDLVFRIAKGHTQGAQGKRMV